VALVTGNESIPNWRAPTYRITLIMNLEQGNAIATEYEYWDQTASTFIVYSYSVVYPTRPCFIGHYMHHCRICDHGNR